MEIKIEEETIPLCYPSEQSIVFKRFPPSNPHFNIKPFYAFSKLLGVRICVVLYKYIFFSPDSNTYIKKSCFIFMRNLFYDVCFSVTHLTKWDTSTCFKKMNVLGF